MFHNFSHTLCLLLTASPLFINAIKFVPIDLGERITVTQMNRPIFVTNRMEKARVTLNLDNLLSALEHRLHGTSSMEDFHHLKRMFVDNVIGQCHSHGILKHSRRREKRIVPLVAAAGGVVIGLGVGVPLAYAAIRSFFNNKEINRINQQMEIDQKMLRDANAISEAFKIDSDSRLSKIENQIKMQQIYAKIIVPEVQMLFMLNAPSHLLLTEISSKWNIMAGGYSNLTDDMLITLITSITPIECEYNGDSLKVPIVIVEILYPVGKFANVQIFTDGGKEIGDREYEYADSQCYVALYEGKPQTIKNISDCVPINNKNFIICQIENLEPLSCAERWRTGNMKRVNCKDEFCIDVKDGVNIFRGIGYNEMFFNELSNSASRIAIHVGDFGRRPEHYYVKRKITIWKAILENGDENVVVHGRELHFPDLFLDQVEYATEGNLTNELMGILKNENEKKNNKLIEKMESIERRWDKDLDNIRGYQNGDNLLRMKLLFILAVVGLVILLIVIVFLVIRFQLWAFCCSCPTSSESYSDTTSCNRNDDIF